MVIGGYDEDLIEKAGTKWSSGDDKSKNKSKDGIFWMNINSNIYWQVNLYDSQIGDTKLKFDKPESVFMDSGASMIYIPTNSYNQIINTMK